MAYAIRAIVERLSDSPVAPPWNLAPKALQDAAAKTDAAISEHLNAASALEDAEAGIPMAQLQWEADGTAAVRAGKDLPNRDIIDRAAFALKIATEDEHLTGRKLSGAQGALGSLLSDQDTRDTWRQAIEKRAGELQGKLAKVAPTIAGDAAETANLLGLTHYLGQWGEHMIPPNVVTVDPAGALSKLSRVKAWQPTSPAGEARIAQPTAPDTRPAVWIVNDLGGIHDVVAKDADALLDQPGWRAATPDEIARARKSQGIKV
jgi:hypothetical protein